MAESAPRIAVVTPYHDEPLAMLRQAHDSVAAQGLGALHLLVADGHPRPEVDGWPAAHLRLPRAHGDNGNTPRGLGALWAEAEGHDFIAFLDADNWFLPGHLPSLLDRWRRTGAPVVAAWRSFRDPAGAELPVREPEEEALAHVDTSCLLLHRAAFAALPVWLRMPRALSPICDRVFLAALRHHRLAVATTGRRTLAFRSRYRAHYEAAGLFPPPDAKGPELFAPAHAFLLSAAGVTACVERLGFWPASYLPAA